MRRKMKVFRKTSVSTLINILGMSVAFAAAMILLVRVHWDFGYDANFKGHEQVFRMEHDWDKDGVFSSYFSRPMIEMVRGTSSNVEDVATATSWGNWTLSREGNPEERVTVTRCLADSSIFQVFPFQWVEGSAKEFTVPATLILSHTMARTFFGDESAVGNYLQVGDGTRFRVVGVYEDLPANSSLAYHSFACLGIQCLEDTSEWSFTPYLKLRNPKEFKSTQEQLTETLLGYFLAEQEADDERQEEFRRQFRIVNLHEAYYEQDHDAGASSVNKSMTLSLLAIAILLIIIAIINFINFSFAEIPFRIKNINTRKVLGESRASLVGKQLLRAAVLALVAFGFSCLILRVVAGTSWASAIASVMSPRDYLAILLPMAGITLAAAVIAGLAPALYSTSQPTAMVLKGTYAMSFKGKTLRNGLVVLQFFLSFVFILLGLYVDLQLRFMQRMDMGFRRGQVLQVTCGEKAGAQLEALEGQLLQDPSILAVTAGDGFIVNEVRMSWGRMADDGTQVNMEVMPVADNYIDFFGLQIVDGRDFLPSDNQSRTGSFIVNEAFLRRYPQFHVGSYVGAHNDVAPIIGVVKDFHSKSLHHSIEPLVLYNWGSEPWRSFSVLYVRVTEEADFQAVSSTIKKAICTLDPTMIPSQVGVRRLDEWIGSMYSVESMLRRLVSIASVVALLIAIIGIIGLVFFETQFLRKGIAVRRVNGATVGGILQMINRKYLIIAGVSFALAAPLAYYLMNTWRQGFVSQAPIPVWIFLVALLAVAAITLAVVTLQSWRAANANPVESLKNE